MKIAIHGRNFALETAPFVQTLFDTLHQKQVEVSISSSFYSFLQSVGINSYSEKTYLHPHGAPDTDFIFSIGGDGTLLECVMQARSRQIPILGFNTGRLGFLATVSPASIQKALASFFDQQFQIEDRTLVSLHSSADLFEDYNFALNDFTITKTDTSSMITVHAYLDGEFLNSYWSDGLIVSTPTGSTGYSLSCGGPVVLPTNNVFIITPISPHNLNVRPMIIPDASKLSFRVESRSNNFLVSLDSRFRIVDETVTLMVKRENFNARLVKLNQDNFVETLRTKLHWGLDARN
ncbi:NAD kinase [Runella sp. MFBS21]|uniref:NAD kinase n=1 Tax=Runella sp. MFBS21 TaxID=3034018 RepID=UPI0023FA4626|nr:NAD kinase [Runella sp. MFBS21]MDF7820583.1 NAD kinase [Runella sp. MFBS21]